MDGGESALYSGRREDRELCMSGERSTHSARGLHTTALAQEPKHLESVYSQRLQQSADCVDWETKRQVAAAPETKE